MSSPIRSVDFEDSKIIVIVLAIFRRAILKQKNPALNHESPFSPPSPSIFIGLLTILSVVQPFPPLFPHTFHSQRKGRNEMVTVWSLMPEEVVFA